MAKAINPTLLSSTVPPPNNSPSQVLLASCRASLRILRNQKWEPVLDSNVFKLQLVRLSGGRFTLLVMNELTIKLVISLRYNTVFKVIRSNFFSLLDNGVTVWGFEIAGQTSDAQTFAIVVQNTLASLKESHSSIGPRTSSGGHQTLPRPQNTAWQERKGDQQFYLNNICLTLSDAISRGNEKFASDLARQLASHKAMVRIKLDEPEKDELSRLTQDNKINLKVQVEDKESLGSHFRLEVTPQTTINQLKQMVQIKYNFPVEIQRWIIGKRLPKPSESLSDCGIKTSGSTLFLYLVSTQSLAGAEPAHERQNIDQTPPVQLHRARSASSIAYEPMGSQVQGEPLYDEVANQYDRVRNNPLSMPNISLEQLRQPVPEAARRVQGWTCPQCTFLNPPTRPGCEMCSSDRPADYRVPEDYMPSEKERLRLDRERSSEMRLREEEEKKRRREVEERDRNFQRLMSIIDQRLVENQEEFECPICFDEIQVGDGVVLRECLHNFCRECLTEHVRNSTEPEVQCPFDNGDFACHDVITLQEIQELLTEEDFQKYLQRSLATAESQAPNSFHCRTPNCQGWCIYDDEVNDFDCPVCGKKNCLTCKAIHHPVNCKEYQDDLKRNAANDEAARKTQEYLEEMLKTKDGMNCPCCGIILVKKDGCDWMKCTMCRTEICWAVRGPRWGPGGPGDTSGGCRCRINNRKCHPQCRNCH